LLNQEKKINVSTVDSTIITKFAGNRSQLFDTGDPVSVLLFSLIHRGDYFRGAGEWEDSSRRYSGCHGFVQEGEDV